MEESGYDNTTSLRPILVRQNNQMTCFSPIAGYRSRTAAKNGGFGIVFKKNLSNGQNVEIACGQCIGCKLDKTKEWAIRCVHEAQLHKDNCFITLTYNEQHLPLDYSLDKTHFQLFIKRLRKKTPHKIRYYMCGEYGDLMRRPHYHAILFGHDFTDKIPTGPATEYTLYTSQQLEQTWGKGFCTVGEMTFDSAGYCARYAMKKITGDNAERHYQLVDDKTGEIHQLKPEYAAMSRRPGIGNAWYKKYKDDLFPEDECVIDGRIMKPPRYYSKILQNEEPQTYEQIKQLRKRFSKKHKDDATWQRLATREQVKIAKINQLQRQLEKQ